jgi:uncharacterized protein (TIGR02246 family)
MLDQDDAIERIKQLKAAYFDALDGKIWRDFAQLFTPDCEFITYKDVANTIPKRRSGPTEITASVQKTTANTRTRHRADLIEIQIRSPDEAEALWEMTDEASLQDGRTFHGAGCYHERYRRLDGAWLISCLELRRSSISIER